MPKNIVGIDLGVTNMLIHVKTSNSYEPIDNFRGERKTSCVVFFSDNGESWFELLFDDFIEKLTEQIDIVLEDAGLEKEEIDRAILIGGSSAIPIAKETLSDYFHDRISLNEVDPDEAKALGATIACYNISNEKFSSSYTFINRVTISDSPSSKKEKEVLLEKIEEMNELSDLKDKYNDSLVKLFKAMLYAKGRGKDVSAYDELYTVIPKDYDAIRNSIMQINQAIKKLK